MSDYRNCRPPAAGDSTCDESDGTSSCDYDHQYGTHETSADEIKSVAGRKTDPFSAQSCAKATDSLTKLTLRPVSLRGGAVVAGLSASVCSSSPAFSARSSNSSPLSPKPAARPAHVPVDPQVRRLAKSFSHMQIDKGANQANTKTTRWVQGGRKSYPGDYGLDVQGPSATREVSLANERMGDRLQRIYRKSRTKPSAPVTIRSRWQLAEAERHREIHRVNRIISRKLASLEVPAL